MGVPVIEITRAGGPITDQLKRQADSAAAHGQVVLVDVGATWCGPCREFQQTLSDSVMVTSLKTARLVHIDYDVWNRDLMVHGYLGAYDLPELFLLTPDGGKGESFDKGRWVAHHDSVHTTTVAQTMGPPLQAFLLAAHAKPKLAR